MGEQPEETETEIRPVNLPAGFKAFDDLALAVTKFAVCAVGLGFLVMVMVDVISRFAFSHSLPQTNSSARYLLVWFFLLGAGLALRQGAHVGMDFFATRLPRRQARVLYVIAQVLMLLFFGEMLWAGLHALAASTRQIDGALGINMAWVMSAFPAAFVLLIYHQIVLVVSVARGDGMGAARP
jgi:TRAP-type C4-dicarboxylate transport system permease small subunit